jgi:hypothetical protein
MRRRPCRGGQLWIFAAGRAIMGEIDRKERKR